VTLTVLGRTINLPAHWAEAIKYALQGEVFRPAELPGLNDDDRLDLARRLLREGVLVVG
jgi:hypothetical protein